MSGNIVHKDTDLLKIGNLLPAIVGPQTRSGGSFLCAFWL